MMMYYPVIYDDYGPYVTCGYGTVETEGDPIIGAYCGSVDGLVSDLSTGFIRMPNPLNPDPVEDREEEFGGDSELCSLSSYWHANFERVCISTTVTFGFLLGLVLSMHILHRSY